MDRWQFTTKELDQTTCEFAYICWLGVASLLTESPSSRSSLDPIQFKQRSVNLSSIHGNFQGEAITFLTAISKEDFNQPRKLWQDVFDDGAKERFIKNITTHMKLCRDKNIIARECAIFAEVDKDLADAIAKEVGIDSYPACKDLEFNGSGNALGDKMKGANGMPCTMQPEQNFNGAPA
jgi:catalase